MDEVSSDDSQNQASLQALIAALKNVPQEDGAGQGEKQGVDPSSPEYADPYRGSQGHSTLGGAMAGSLGDANQHVKDYFENAYGGKGIMKMAGGMGGGQGGGMNPMKMLQGGGSKGATGADASGAADMSGAEMEAPEMLAMAKGGHFVARHPMHLLVGEAGPEDVNVKPMRKPGPAKPFGF